MKLIFFLALTRVAFNACPLNKWTRDLDSNTNYWMERLLLSQKL